LDELNLKTDILKEYEIPIASNKELFNFQNSIKLIFEKMLANANQIRTLENLRDTLLPKLMSGELSVSLDE
jgi:type I restriction enzyme S subunit